MSVLVLAVIWVRLPPMVSFVNRVVSGRVRLSSMASMSPASGGSVRRAQYWGMGGAPPRPRRTRPRTPAAPPRFAPLKRPVPIESHWRMVLGPIIVTHQR